MQIYNVVYLTRESVGTLIYKVCVVLESFMTTNFYDKVAKKFGGYAFGKGHVNHLTEYPTGDPEEIFKKKLAKFGK